MQLVAHLYWQFNSSSVVASLQNKLISFGVFLGQLAAVAHWFHHNLKELEGLVMECIAILSKMNGRKLQCWTIEQQLWSSHVSTIFQVNVWFREWRISKSARKYNGFMWSLHVTLHWSDVKFDVDRLCNELFPNGRLLCMTACDVSVHGISKNLPSTWRWQYWKCQTLQSGIAKE